MLERANEIIGKRIVATDGDLGHVADLYFDDHDWVVRYFVVDTGGWLGGRLVLIAPEAIVSGGMTDDAVAVSLTKQRVEHSPGIDSAKPVSRQEEIPYREYFGWPPYGGSLWGVAGIGLNPPLPAITEQAMADHDRAVREGDPHLRSVSVVDQYRIEASDGEIGHVEDFIVDTDTWSIRYAVVDTRNWLPGKKVLVSPDLIHSVEWATSIVRVDLTRERIKDAPEYDHAQPIAPEYERALREYYAAPAHTA